MTYTAPHADMCEGGLIFEIMQDSSQLKLIETLIAPSDFFVPVYSEMYKEALALRSQNMQCCGSAILHRLESTGKWTRDFLNATMKDLFQMGGQDVMTCANIVKDCSFKRQLVSLAKSLTESAEKHDNKACHKYQEQIAAISMGHSVVLPDNPLEQLQAAFTLANDGEKMIKTGIEGWDDMFGGLSRGARYIIAGRAGSGKTALALNILWNISKNGLRTRHIFFEGSIEETWWRIMARETATPITSFRKGLTPHQIENVTKQQDKLMGYDFAVVRDPVDVSEMIARCGKCDVIVLDGISSAPAPKAETIIDRVQTVTGYCKTLADKTGAAVIMLAHLNSEGVKAAASGTGIYGGQAATFDPEGILELKLDEETKADRIKRIEGHVTKNRYGETGKMNLTFNGEYMTYVG